jgi:hypothetical protein
MVLIWLTGDFASNETAGGGPDRTRTCDLRFRKPLLYPAELRDPVWGISFSEGECIAPSAGARIPKDTIADVGQRAFTPARFLAAQLLPKARHWRVVPAENLTCINPSSPKIRYSPRRLRWARRERAFAIN